MSQAIKNLNVVHETEVQRQFSRVKIPATLSINKKEFKVQDMSAGGFSLENSSKEIEPNKLYKGQLSLTIDGFDFSYSVEFNTLTQLPNNNIGCTFQNVDKRFSSALRYIITAFLSGELLATGDIINTLSRENHTDARNKKQLVATNKLERVKAMVGSLIFLVIGLSALTFVSLKLFGMYFVQSSKTAMVTAESHTLSMPKAGNLEPLVSKGLISVSKGQLLATFSGVELEAETSNLPQETQDILAKSLKQTKINGSISSPCDCKILSVNGIYGQFLQKGDPTFTLISNSSRPFISAKFSFKDAESLQVGQSVVLKNLGEVDGEFVEGKIDKLTVEGKDQDVTVLITTSKSIGLNDINKPVKVIASSKFAQTYLSSWL